MAQVKIDINCDLGEGQGEKALQQDNLLMAYISSCNIACGGHAGNSHTMSNHCEMPETIN